MDPNPTGDVPMSDLNESNSDSAVPMDVDSAEHTRLPSKSSMDMTIEVYLRAHLDTLSTGISELSDTVKQTTLLEYRDKPPGFILNEELRGLLNACVHPYAVAPTPDVGSPVSNIPTVPSSFAVHSVSASAFLDTLRREFWPQGDSSLPSHPSLPDMTDVQEPTRVFDLRSTLPCIGRSDNIEMLRAVIQQAYEAWKKNFAFQSNLSLPVPVVCGGSGRGKTYFCRLGIQKLFRESGKLGDFEHACTFTAEKHLNIGILFKNVVAGEKAYSGNSLALQLTYEVFKGFPAFMDKYPTVKSLLSLFATRVSMTLLDLQRFLKKQLGLPSGATTILSVHLDQIDRALRGADFTHLKNIIDAFETINMQQDAIFFSLLLSGKESTAILNALKSRRSYRGYPIDLKPITWQEYHQGLCDFLSARIGDGPECKPIQPTDISKGLQRILLDIEGVPKFFVILLHVLSSLEGLQSFARPKHALEDWTINRERIRKAVIDTSADTNRLILVNLYDCVTSSQAIPSWTTSDDATLAKILCYAITDIPVTRETWLDREWERSPTFSDLERDGKLILRPLIKPGKSDVNAAAIEYRVTFPLILLKSILLKTGSAPGSYTLTERRGPLYWQEAEDMDGTWFLYRLKAFKELHGNFKPLRDLLPMDDELCKSLRTRSVDLSGPIEDSLLRLLHKITQPQELAQYIDPNRRGCYGFKNAPGAESWDWAIILPLRKSRNLLLMGQSKMSMEGERPKGADAPTISKTVIETERRKVDPWFNAPSEVKRGAGYSTCHFVVVSDRRFVAAKGLDKGVKKTTSVVHRDVMKDYFGEMMGARRQAACDFRLPK
ncbi:uncharacterized protein EV420DRAFT_892455 [Desarmillaria tabescens]|uniref:Uncharacterized protein n=1 Tax=Armillaria tabescens TaxID=1929756 RepID=A0AA39MUC3_ARMTA|nr:uncharacterized protein EV420DRAFT_892455 [Desarmillaria tabescens]KAK0446523.1 hypothetical protein EV420DRAFT_892455 [Desarmillaria tabescens]